MQWKTVTTGLGNTAFALLNNGRKMLTLAYKGQSDAVYLESELGEKRYLHYKKKGLLTRNYVLENEYGAEIGIIKKEKHQEYIRINDARYILHYTNPNNIEISAEGADKPVAVCSLDAESVTEKTTKSLLMVLCLYLFGRRTENTTPGWALH